MTHEWKPGDQAMVEIGYVTPNGKTVELCYGGKETADAISSSILFHLPPSLTPEAQAVLDALREWNTTGKGAQKVGADLILNKAIDAWRITLPPPDPLKEVVAAWEMVTIDDITMVRGLGRLGAAITAIAAIEKERK